MDVDPAFPKILEYCTKDTTVGHESDDSTVP